VPKKEVEWKGPITMTRPLRTIIDCKLGAVAPDLIRQAIDQAVRRGDFTRIELGAAMKEARG
jgi:hypothetical protein